MKKIGKITKTGFIKGIDTSEFKKGDKLYLDPDNPGGLKTMTKLELLQSKLYDLINYQNEKLELIGFRYTNTLENSLNELEIAWLKLKIAIGEIFVNSFERLMGLISDTFNN